MDTEVASGNGQIIAELEDQEAVARLRDSLVEAASESREALAEQPQDAARRAAVDIATATLKASSTETAEHSDDVDVIAEGIARRLGLTGQGLEDVRVAARLHDIGKVGVTLQLIEKPTSLNEEEWATIRRHTIMGEQILLSVPELRGAARLVRHSHERWDGDGYPDGLGGEEIPLGSRIIFCADAFHAIRSHRPYRPGRSAEEALAEMRACAGTQFDPAVVKELEALAALLRGSERNGRARSASSRARRLTALMLVIGIGATSSALARSGLIPEAKGAPGQGAAVTAGGEGAAGTVAGAPWPADVGAADTALGSSVATGGIKLLSSLPSELIVPPEALGSPGTGESLGAPIGLPGAPAGSEGKSGSAPGESRGVRDHGRGVGRGSGKGKGRGVQLGRGHSKVKGSHQSSGSKGGRASAHGGAGATKAKTGSGQGKPAATGSGSNAAPATQQPKPPQAPKPPTTPAPPAPGDSGGGLPPTSGTPGGGGAAGGGNAGGGTPGGSGNAGGEA